MPNNNLLLWIWNFLMSITPEWISAIAAAVVAVGVLFAFKQLRLSKNIAQLQFEDSLAKEYRNLINGIPAIALLGEDLSEEKYQELFDQLFRYIDLTNEEVSLRQRKRISEEVWQYWLSGIQMNLRLPAFHRAWTEIKGKSESFQELRRLENEAFKIDPAKWENA
jgi:hypothetical protein